MTMETTDNLYVENAFREWENISNNMRKKLPAIYKNANEETKTIIAMLVVAEYDLAIKNDNECRRNGAVGTNADKYKEENKEIMDLVYA